MKTLPLHLEELFADEPGSDLEPLARWDEYFSLGAWPQFGQIPDLVIPVEFIEGNTP